MNDTEHAVAKMRREPHRAEERSRRGEDLGVSYYVGPFERDIMFRMNRYEAIGWLDRAMAAERCGMWHGYSWGCRESEWDILDK